MRQLIRPFISLSIFIMATVFFHPAEAQSGKLERVAVPGPSLEGNLSQDDSTRMVSVYLPPGYATNPNQRYPVVYLLHGYTDSDENWFGLTGEHFVNVPSAIDAAWANGEKELIIVMPNAYTKFWGSMYSNSATTGDWEAFVAEDLVAYIDANYRTLAARASRGLAGHSMGGYGALRIGMKYPEVFSSLYAMSPCCMAPNLHPSVEQMARAEAVQTDADIAALDFGTKATLASAAAWSSNPRKPPFYIDLPIQNGQVVDDVVARWVANAPLAMVHQYLPALRSFKALRFDAGNMDTGIAATVRELDTVLDNYGIPHETEEYQGDHVSHIHELLTTVLMPLFSANLAF